MTIKICGISTLQDAVCAYESGADAVGFIFHQSSVRYITPQKVKAIAGQLPPYLQKVGVFTTHTPQAINEMMGYCKLSLAQLHNSVDKGFLNALQYPYIEVIRTNQPRDIANLPHLFHRYYLVDSFVKAYGGEGRAIDLSWFDGVDCSRFILAGGVTIERIEAISAYGFYGVDVSSGVEREKGIKDHHKIKAFINKVKAH